jgi:Mg-chelatase subunit ChlD
MSWASASARPTDPPATLVVVALDSSGSVGRASLARAKDLVPALLASLPAGSEVAVIAFDDQPHVVVPRTSSPEQITPALEGVQVAGRFTALHDAIFDATRYAREAPAPRKAIVLVTDGVDDNSALDFEDGLKAAREAQMPVFTIGVGAHPREHVLRRIAKLTGGDYTPFEQVRAAELAARIASASPVADEGRATKRGTAAARGGEGGPSAADARSAAPTSGSGRLIAWTLMLLGVLAAGVLAMVRRGHGTVVRVPRPSPVAALPPATTIDAPRPSIEPELSATVLARMNQTEEFLERTIALLERPVLAVTRGTRAGEVFELSGSSALSIGRSRVNDIQINDVSVSAQHCRVRPEDGRFVLHDLKSTNGTLVNEKRVGRHVLEEGDVITIGETAIQYRREMTRSPAA